MSLDGFYPIVYLDCIMVKICQDKTVRLIKQFFSLWSLILMAKRMLGLWIPERLPCLIPSIIPLFP